jgi:hypothetical protein
VWVEISLGAGIVSPAPRHTEDQRFFPGAASKALLLYLFGRFLVLLGDRPKRKAWIAK